MNVEIGKRYYCRWTGFDVYECVVLLDTGRELVVELYGGHYSGDKKVLKHSELLVRRQPFWRSLWRRLTGGKGGGR